MTDQRNLDYLNQISMEDVDEILMKEKTYQGSWKKRGGIGAAMMMLRKIDRLENMLAANSYDVFALVQQDISGKDGSALAEIRDLRRYLLLIESEFGEKIYGGPRVKKILTGPGTPEDGGHHARQEENELDDILRGTIAPDHAAE